MANEKNLIPFTSEQSREEAVKNGRKGGIKSGESKREKKDVKERLKQALDIAITNPKEKKKLEAAGFENPTWADKLVFDMLSNSKNPNMVKLIMEYSGDKDGSTDNGSSMASLIDSIKRKRVQ